MHSSISALVVSCEAAPRIGGVGSIANGLKAYSDIIVISPQIANYLYVSKYFRWAWGLVWPFELLFRIAICRSVWTLNFKVLIANDYGSLLVLSILTSFHKKLKSKSAYIYHGDIKKSRLALKVFKSAVEARLASSCVNSRLAVSNYLSNALSMRNLRVPVPVVHFGLSKDAHNIVSSLKQKNLFLNTRKNNISLGIFSRINPYKLPISFIKLLERAAGDLIEEFNISLNIYGPCSDEMYIQSIIICCDKLRVTYHGAIKSSLVLAKMSEVDVVVNASLLPEAAPLVAFEASALDKPYMWIGENGSNEIINLYNHRDCLNIPTLEYCQYQINNIANFLKLCRNSSYGNLTTSSIKVPDYYAAVNEIVRAVRS